MDLQKIIANINASSLKTDIPRMDIGDTVNVHCRIVEGDKERVQVFQGVLIARSGSGINEMITVRRVVEDTGVERILPINSPRIAGFEVVRRGDSRRAKLYYLRDRAGKSRRLRDRRRGSKHVQGAVTASPSLKAQPAAAEGEKKA
jgi:large subunit ribosomal protein L19